MFSFFKKVSAETKVVSGVIDRVGHIGSFEQHTAIQVLLEGSNQVYRLSSFNFMDADVNADVMLGLTQKGDEVRLTLSQHEGSFKVLKFENITLLARLAS